MESSAQPVAAPWWKFGYVWMVIAGPAIVVVAGFVTLFLALSHPDPVLTEGGAGKARSAGQSLVNPGASLAPAMQARNHAQTGVATPPAGAPATAVAK